MPPMFGGYTKKFPSVNDKFKKYENKWQGGGGYKRYKK